MHIIKKGVALAKSITDKEQSKRVIRHFIFCNFFKVYKQFQKIKTQFCRIYNSTIKLKFYNECI